MIRKLTPNLNKHFKDINTGEIYEGEIYLGIYDTPYNYIEVSEEEYQEYLKNRSLIYEQKNTN